MKPRKVPLRMCVGCREMKPKRELVRIVRTESGCMLDKTGKAPGRGAYICKNAACLEKAIKIGAISRALETPLSKETAELLKGELTVD